MLRSAQWHKWISFFLLVAVLTWHVFIAPYILSLSENFSYKADVISYDNFYDEKKQEYGGEQRSITQFYYEAIDQIDSSLQVKNTFDVRSLSGEPIFAVDRIYGVDKNSKRHDQKTGDKKRDGYLFAPQMKGLTPQVSDKSPFNYWHINYDQPIGLIYKGEEVLFNTDVYHYQANFVADQTKNLSSLPGVGDSKGITLEVELNLWVEPYSGYLVKYEDFATAYYYDLETGDQLNPWNQFHNRYSDASVSQHSLKAGFERQKIILVEIWIPVLLMFLALLFYKKDFFLRFYNQGHHGLNRQDKIWLLPSVALVVTIGMSLGGAYLAKKFIDQIEENDFQSEVEQINDMIVDRLEIYTNALYGGRGLFDASENVERQEWKSYVESLAIQRGYPGIQGLGYSEWIESSELESHIDRIQSEGFPDYTVRPQGDRPEYTAIVYLEPFDIRNQQAFGFDMFQEATRREAMNYARNTGNPALSGKVTLVQEIDEDVQAGFLIYIPVYKKNATLSTVKERQSQLEGFVYSPFRMNNFIEGVLLSRFGLINIEIFDGYEVSQFSEEKRMYGKELPDAHFINKRNIEFGGSSWTVRYSVGDDYGANFLTQVTPPTILLIGITIGLFLFSIFYMLSSRQASTIAMAREMNRDLLEQTEENEKIKSQLKEVNTNLKKQAKELAKKIEETEKINSLMVNRELRMIELKKQLNKKQNKK